MKAFSPLGRRTFLAGAMATAVASATASCTFEGDDTGGSGDGGEGGENAMVFRQSMPPVPHLDGHVSNPGSASGNIIQGGLFEGLVVSGTTAEEVLPGVAESWQVSDDGLIYTFTIRSDAKWSNGDPVVGSDFVWNFERLMSPQTPREGNSPYHPKTGIAGATAFVNGETDDFSTVGIKAPDDATVEITLETLNPDLLFALTEWRYLPLHPATVQDNPDSWSEPANWVSNGPFVLEAWRTNANATLVPNEEYWDRGTIHIDRWEVRFSDGGDSAEMVSYGADEIDLFRIESDLASVTNDPEMAEQLATSLPGQWKHLILINSENEALQDIRVRQALSLAIDRDSLAELARPDVPGYSLVPEAIPGSEEIPQTHFDLDQAKSLLADAGYPDGEGLPTITFLIPQQSTWIEAVGGMWQENLGVQTTIDLVEVGVWREKRKKVHGADYCGFQYGYIGGTPTLYNAGMHSVASGADYGWFLLPPDAARQCKEIDADESLNGAEKLEQLTAIREANWPDIWQQYESLAESTLR